MAGHWQSLVANLAVVALFISVWVNGRSLLLGRLRRDLAFGALMGAGAVASMMLAISWGGVFFDLRLSLIALAGFFGGPLAALVAVVIALAYRVFLAGPAVPAAAASILATAVAGVAVSRVTRGRLPALASGGVLAVVVAGISLGLSVILSLLSSSVLGPLSLPVALMNALGTGLCAFYIMRGRVMDRERDLFRTAFIESPDFQYVKTLDGRFSEVNAGVAKINGFSSPAEMIGKTDFDLVGADRANALMQAERRILETGEPLRDLEELVVDAAGNEIWYLTTKVPLHNRDGEIIGLGGVTRDITARKRLRMEVIDSRNQLNYVLSEISDGIAMFDRQGTLVYRNEQYAALFPLTTAIRRSGQHIRDILEAVTETSEQRDIPAGGEAAWIDEIAATLLATGEQEIQLFDGRWLHVRTRPTSDGSALVVVSDVTRIKQTEAALLLMTEQLQLLATTDGLTGLMNRRAFDQAFEDDLLRHRRSQSPLAVLMIDVDNFKRYNDIYGHLAGDEVLKRVARCLKDALRRSGDVAARYGGEEFIAILPDTDEDGALFIADDLRDGLHRAGVPHKGGDKGFVTASIGVAALAGDDVSTGATELLRRADEALYGAKDAGRDQSAVWRPRPRIVPDRGAAT